MKQIFILFAVIIALIIFLDWSQNSNSNLNQFLNSQLNFLQGSSSKNSSNKETLKINDQILNVAIAKTTQERTEGLSKYDTIDDNFGMLFVFDQKDIKPSFWMKGMKFSIDIIWIKDNKVSQITDFIPTLAKNTADTGIPLYSPDQPIDYVLEVKAGISKKSGIKPGDTVNLPQF